MMVLGWLLRPHSRWDATAGSYVDGELQEPKRGRFERHLAGCARCRQRTGELRQVRLLIASMDEVAAPRSFRLTPAMLSEAPAAPRPEAQTPRLAWAARAAAATAAVAVIALIATLAAGSSTSSETSTASSDLAPALSPATAAGSEKSAGGPDAFNNGTATFNGAAATPALPPSPRGIATPDTPGVGAQSLPSSTAVATPAAAQPNAGAGTIVASAPPAGETARISPMAPESGAHPTQAAPSESSDNGIVLIERVLGLVAIVTGFAAIGLYARQRRR
jgi:hypothetical protein